MLRPTKNTHKCLLSTPAQVIGDFETDDLVITHAWPELMAPNTRLKQLQQGPTHRRFVVVTFTTEESPPSIVIPNYHWMGDLFAVCFAIFFGKRFDHHGFTETNGMFCVPSYETITSIGTFRLPPYDPKPRKNFGFDLDLRKIAVLSDLLHLRGNEKAIDTLFTSGGFYLRALRFYEEQPEISYVDLVTAGEVLATYFKYSDEELFDSELLTLFAEIRDTLRDGQTKLDSIKKRLFQVRRRFKLTLRALLCDEFFTVREATEPWATIPKDHVESAITAAYDLRSRYVHTGERFGQWIRSMEDMFAECCAGSPVIDDKDYRKLIVNSPTFVGLERIIRLCLLRFMHREVSPIDSGLD